MSVVVAIKKKKEGPRGNRVPWDPLQYARQDSNLRPLPPEERSDSTASPLGV